MGDVVVKKTTFKIISDPDRIPFSFKKDSNGLFSTDAEPLLIDIAEDDDIIQVVERGIITTMKRFEGKPEPIKNSDGITILQPSEDGKIIEKKQIGEFKCVRCGGTTTILQKNGKITEPFECEQDFCGRRGPFQPLFPVELIKPIWKLPYGASECSAVSLYQTIFEFIKNYVIMREVEYHIMTLWIMASWLVDNFDTCPYLLFIAPKSSGKSQAMRVLEQISYRALLSISTTPSALFRSIEMWNITLLIDEAENQVRMDSETGQALYGCLNGGYKRNSYAIRIEGEARLPTTYDVFGFKAIASTKVFHPTLESRSIIINMSQGMPKKILIDGQDAEHIRSKLLYFKFAYYNKLLITLPKSNNGRLIEMFIPLYTVAQIFKDSGLKTFIEYDDILSILDAKIKEMESVRKEEEKESLEARIINMLFELIRQDLLSYDARKYVIVKDIASSAGLNEPNSAQIVGLKLKVMGIKTEHKKIGSCVNYEEKENSEKLVELEKRFRT